MYWRITPKGEYHIDNAGKYIWKDGAAEASSYLMKKDDEEKCKCVLHNDRTIPIEKQLLDAGYVLCEEANEKPRLSIVLEDFLA